MTSRQPGTTPSQITWLVRLLPLTLLIILGLAGLRGAVGSGPRIVGGQGSMANTEGRSDG